MKQEAAGSGAGPMSGIPSVHTGEHVNFLSAVRAQRVLPVLRVSDEDAAVRCVEELAAAGCQMIELTTTTPHWERALARAARSTAGSVLVGMGTVRTAVQARSAIEHGAGFLVSPHLAPAVVEVARQGAVDLLQGGLTPTELAAAATAGPVKLFPAHLGGPSYLASIRTILPNIPIIPTGGITLSEVDKYLAAGAHAVGIGSGLPADPDALAAVFAGCAS